MGDVEDLLDELEDADDETTEKALKKRKKKAAKNQDELELDIDSAWGSPERDD